MHTTGLSVCLTIINDHHQKVGEKQRSGAEEMPRVMTIKHLQNNTWFSAFPRERRRNTRCNTSVAHKVVKCNNPGQNNPS